MKREPSIHITQSKLKQIINEFHDYAENSEEYIDEMVEFMMKRARPFSLEKRTIIPNSKTSKKVEVKISNDKSDYNLLANIIYTVRKKLKHKGIKAIDINSSEYSTLKKLTIVINQFCEEFNLDKRQGYIEYTQAGLKKISSFRGYLNKLIDMSESISLEYEAIDIINNDKVKSITKQIHDEYTSRVFDKTGIPTDYTDKPTQYINFIKVREFALKYNVAFQDYLDAQFEGLEWTGSYPEPSQLVNEKSIERLNKYMYQNHKKKIHNNHSTKTDKKLTDVLKRIRNGNHNDA